MWGQNFVSASNEQCVVGVRFIKPSLKITKIKRGGFIRPLQEIEKMTKDRPLRVNL